MFKQGMIPWNKGKTGLLVHTPEAKKRIGKAALGNKHGIGNKNHLGKKHTIESRMKMSLALKGREVWNNISTSNTSPYGIQFKISWSSVVDVEILSQANKGEKAHQWIEDRTKLKDDSKERGGQLHKEWSKTVKNRDKWKCRIDNEDCLGKLEAHHIVSWSQSPELRYEVNNGITLCHYHHPRKREEEQRLIPTFKEMVLRPIYELALSR